MHHSDPPSGTYFNAWQHWAFRVEQRLQEQQDMIQKLQQELDLLKQQLTREQQSPATIHVDKIEYHFDQLKVDTLEGSLQIGLSTSNPEQLPMMIEDIMMKQQHDNGAIPAANESVPKKQAQAPFTKYGKKSNAKLYNLEQNFQNSNAKVRQQNGQTDSELPLEQTQNNKNVGQGPAASNSELINQQLIDHCIQVLNSDLNNGYKHYITRQSSLMNVDMNEEHMKLIIDDISRQLPARVHHYLTEQQIKLTHANKDNLLQQVISLTKRDIEEAIDRYIYQLTQKPEG